MQLVVKRFDELTAEELFQIYKVRVAIFVVEQRCPYQEVDEADRAAVHVYLRDENGIQAYLRVLPAGAVFRDVSLGRVLTVKRGCGLGRRILSAGLQVARQRFGAERITIAAQAYAREFYEKAGFAVSSDEFVEDGIPHVKMVWTRLD